MALRAFRGVVLATFLPVLAACAAADVAAPTDDVVAAVIVGPKQPSGPEAVVRAVRAVLGGAAGVRYVRPLAGDAHLLHLTQPATRQQVPGMIERLRASGAFRYVEIDSPMKIQ